MQRSRSILAIALMGVLVAACGGSGATQAPGGATQDPGGGGATQNPGGGGGSKPAGWDQYGKASYEISAPVSLSGELGFIPAASSFGGDQATSLSFTYEGASDVLTIQLTQGRAVTSFGSATTSVVGSTCTTSNLSIQASSASGSFECTDVLAVMASGTQVTNVTMKGNFNVHG